MIKLLVGKGVEGGDLLPLVIIEDTDDEDAKSLFEESGSSDIFSFETTGLVSTPLSIVECELNEDDPDYLDILSITPCSEKSVKALYQ